LQIDAQSALGISGAADCQDGNNAPRSLVMGVQNVDFQLEFLVSKNLLSAFVVEWNSTLKPVFKILNRGMCCIINVLDFCSTCTRFELCRFTAFPEYEFPWLLPLPPGKYRDRT
jgi:hypothetical protein